MKATKTITYNVEDFELTFEPIEDTIKINEIKTGYEVKYLINDENGYNPREDNNIGIMVCFHRRYTLGDKTELKSDNFNDWEELYNHLKKEEKAICILPLYLYDHSGISIKVGSFIGHAQHAEWDSGQVGFIYTTKEQLNKIGVTTKSKKKIETYLRNEVETYNHYITGECYELVKELYGKDKEQIDYDTLGGFLGYDDSLKALESEI